MTETPKSAKSTLQKIISATDSTISTIAETTALVNLTSLGMLFPLVSAYAVTGFTEYLGCRDPSGYGLASLGIGLILSIPVSMTILEASDNRKYGP